MKKIYHNQFACSLNPLVKFKIRIQVVKIIILQLFSLISLKKQNQLINKIF